MEIIAVQQRTEDLISTLTDVWERSVRETHLFLSPPEIDEIKKYVPQALNDVAHLIVAVNENCIPAAFMGITEARLEMLFIAPESRGKGLGKRLVEYGIEKYSLNEVTVNEQNPLAIGFYEHMGFRVYKRTSTDEEGRPYPLLYMHLNRHSVV